jgi:hypothetical protein
VCVCFFFFFSLFCWVLGVVLGSIVRVRLNDLFLSVVNGKLILHELFFFVLVSLFFFALVIFHFFFVFPGLFCLLLFSSSSFFLLPSSSFFSTGVQPAIPQNPSAKNALVQQRRKKMNPLIKPVVAHVLSVELQKYFEEVCFEVLFCFFCFKLRR